MDRPRIYCIRTDGHLHRHLLLHFELMAFDHTEEGQTKICGRFDQAALRGLLAHLGDLGVALHAVNLVDTEEESTREEST
jgi:hypothetical protein